MLVPDEVVMFDEPRSTGDNTPGGPCGPNSRRMTTMEPSSRCTSRTTARLWTGGLLERVLDEEIRRARARLAAVGQRRAHALRRPSGRRSSASRRPKHSLRLASDTASAIGP